jgi:hypothetical protein
MTKDEFERDYAERSGVTVEWLHEQGQFPAPCDCGLEFCRGWAMVSRNRSPKCYALEVRGKEKAWLFDVWIDPKHLDDWRKDGLTIEEIV